MSTDARPSVFDYLDSVYYLQDYYKWRKSLSAHFSYEKIADEMNFSSRSYVRMVFMGKKKISSVFLKAFSDLTCETEDEKNFLQTLVDYSQSKSRVEKEAHGKSLVQFLRGVVKRTEVPVSTGFISDPLLPRLFTLLSFRDLKKTTASLARLTGLPVLQVTQALEKLEKMQLAIQDQVSKEWKAPFEFFEVPEDKGNFDLLTFHELSLKDAVKSFDLPSHLRRFHSLFLPMTAQELKNFSKQLDDFIAVQLSQLRSDTLRERRLYQVNLNLHPVTDEASSEHMTL